jgi:hexosaminidase
MENFDHFGAMLDCSRGAVMNVESVKKMASLLKKMGYDTLLLYTEDTYTIESEPYFGYLRGRYSPAEIKEIDAYCHKEGIELVPCIQTLAHLNGISRWSHFSPVFDCQDVLMVDAPETYELIDKMFASLADTFSSRKVHIGMDETFALGLGRYVREHGYTKPIDLYLRHLAKVVEIAKKHGFSPMAWSDMLFRATTHGEYYDTASKIPEGFLAKIPSSLSLIYWDYYHTEKDYYAAMISDHQAFGHPLWAAGGVWSWAGFAPENAYAMASMKGLLEACKEKGVRNFFLTAWKDNGGECSFFACLPSFFYASEIAKGIEDEKTIEKDFKATFGVAYEDFLLFDSPNEITLTKKKHTFENPSKYLLYNDPLLGLCDGSVKREDDAIYLAHAKALKAAEKRLGDYAYLARYYGSLCSLLALKNSLGQRTREAYQKKDKKALQDLLPRYEATYRRTEKFLRDFRSAWLQENKVFGFEVQELRLGGLLFRLKSAADRLEAYLRGEISQLDELEETLLDVDGVSGAKMTDEAKVINNWQFNATVNLL